MKCQTLFSEKHKKNISIYCLLKILPGVLRLKTGQTARICHLVCIFALILIYRAVLVFPPHLASDFHYFLYHSSREGNSFSYNFKCFFFVVFFGTKHILWVLIGTVSMRQFQ